MKTVNPKVIFWNRYISFSVLTVTIPTLLLLASFFPNDNAVDLSIKANNPSFFAPPPNLNDNTCNNVSNDEFNSSTDNWYLSTQPLDTASFSIDNTSQLSGTNSALIDISTASGTGWHIQLSQSGHSLVNGTTYYIRFDARAVTNRTISVRVQEATSPYTTYHSQDVDITSAHEEYGIYSFTAPANVPNAILKFEMGQSDENVYIDDVVFGEMDCYLSEYTNTNTVVSASTDDAEENTSTGIVSTANVELNHNTSTLVGTRFPNVTVPQGAYIIDAYIEYTTYAQNNSLCDMRLRAQDIDDAPAFSTTSNDISSRTTTGNTIYSNTIDSWNSANEKRFSRSIATIVQDVINRPGWSSGNALAIITETTAGTRQSGSYDLLNGSGSILHVAYTTGEVCNNGIDDDGDGLIDCADCSDCGAISACSGSDNDEVTDVCDLDDDNDGIPDVNEYMCNSTESYTATWHHNSLPYDSSYLYEPAWFSSLDNMLLGSGLSAYYTTSLVALPGINQTTLTGAIADNDYLEYGITSAAGIDAVYINKLRSTVHGTISTGAVPDNYGYDIAVLISEDNFATYSPLVSQFTFTSAIGTGISIANFSTDDNFYYLTPATSYQIRVYFFNKTTSAVVDAWFDDFSLFIVKCNEVLDSDGDGVYNHVDLDSDNDGLFDVDEAGHTEADVDNDGRLDGAPSTFGTNGLFNGIETTTDSDTLNYSIADSESSPDGIFDAYELDADGDGCYDLVEEGMIDPDNDGLTGTGIPSVYSDGRTDDNTYFTPSTYVNWQNPAVAICLPEICNNGIDDDGDGLIDCADSECSLCDAFCGDNDNDGIGDVCDLDDDNDGILDDVEALQLNSYADSGYCTIPFIDFTGPVLESGTDTEVGAVYRYSNVTPDLDVLVTIVALTNASINSIDMEGGIGFDDAFQPSLLGLSVGLAVAEINFQFVDTGTSTPCPAIERIGGTFYDLDGTSSIARESVKIGYPAVIGWDSPNLLDISNPVDGWEITSQGTYEGPSIDPDTRLRIYFSYREVNNFTIKFQQYRASSSGTRFFSMRFNECEITDFENIQLLVLEGFDHDNDGIDNHLDLDSDNDGIYDLNEAGHSAPDTDANGIIDGLPAAFGNNGVYDALETYADSDTINYTLADSETTRDSIYDFFELDADGDACFDAREAGVSDTDLDGIAGTGLPTVDLNGLVTSITYTAPSDTFWINPIIAVCNPEICNDGIDNDGDGLVDYNDSDCCSAQAPVLNKN